MVRLLVAGLAATAAVLVFQAPAPAAAQDNVAAGRRVFTTSCALCHMATANGHSMVGPNLYGVVGRRAASAPGFAYSPAMRGAAITWTPAQIEAFVQHPAQVVPGTHMTFAGLRSPEQATAVAAYLNSLAPPR